MTKIQKNLNFLNQAQANRLKNAMTSLGWSEEMLKSFVIKKLKIISDPFKMNAKNTSKLIFILEKIKKGKDSK
ncbi:hypothetical protein [Campylobacter iguaniorum]|uniref:hypothetical protein n=1 Tax=Campylobacter iguaniorum TaxID=1244531 RepID=UPI0019130AA9|nr:hypothetical protein [Campylobacter iguaniorum]